MKKRLLSLLLCMLMLVGLIPAGLATAFAAENDLASTGDYDYTDPDNPYMATDLNGLKEVFEKERPKGTTVYIKLAKDIFTSVHTGTLNLLTTNGADVVLDLAGYTMGITSNYSILMIEGVNGTVTIEDSKRYDSAKKQWVDGRLEFECQTHLLGYSQTYVLAGNIIVKGGVIKNNNHSAKRQDCGYYGRNLEMYGGTLDADYPIYLCSLGDLKKCAVHDGTLRVRRDVAISSPFADFIVPNRHPVIERCFIENASDNEKVSAVNLALMRDFTEKYTADDAFKLWYTIVSPETYAFINGVRQPQGSHGVLYNGDGALVGPLFRESYVLTPLTTINQISVTIDEPAAGKAMSYKASGEYLKGYDVSSYTSGTWSSGVQWTDGADFTSEYPVGSAFARGNRYAVFIKVQIAQKGFGFADESSMTATINGQKALLYKSGDNEYTVYKTFTLDKITVSKAPITVTAPKAGELPSYSAKTPGTGYAVQTGYSASGIKNGVAWMHEGGTAMKDGEKFEAGKKYMVLVFIEPSDTANYKFAASTDMTAAINGNTALIIPYSSVSYGIVCTFDLSNQITDMAVTIPSTRAGEQMKWTASAPGDADYQLQPTSSNFSYGGVMWKIDGATVVVGKTRYFEEGTTYAVTIFLEAKDGYTFAAQDDMSATVNGEAATVSRTSDTKVTVTYTFTASNDTPAEIYILGDTDGNGKVDIFDASAIQKSLAGSAGYPKYSEMSKTDISFKVADVDGNGTVDIFDASLIQKFLAGSDAAKAYPIGKPI